MPKKFTSRQTGLPLQPAKSPFSPRPFAPAVQAKVQENTTATPSVKHSSQNSNLLSRVTHSEPVSESQQIGSEVGSEGPEIQHKIQRKYQNNLTQVSALPPTPPSAPRFPIQAKLTVGAAGDKYEQEADRVARQVVNRIQAPQVNLQSSESNPVQRKIRSQTVADKGGDVSSDWEGQLNLARGGGRRLSPSLREKMEQEFGADFSGVRVHTDGQADNLAKSIQAKAFTIGQDVFFQQGVYQPGTPDGQELIAHELAHVVQQKGGASIQRMPIDNFQEVIEEQDKINLNEFILWFQTEFTIWQNIGAFDSTVLGQNKAGDVVYGEMYKNYEEYIQDTAFTEEILKFHIRDYINKTGHGDDPEYQRYLNFDRTLIRGPEGILALQEMENMKGDARINYTKGFDPNSKQTQMQKSAYPEMYAWLMEEGTPLPTKFNCWEACLIAGFKANLLTKEKIKKLIGREGEQNNFEPKLGTIISKKGRTVTRLSENEESKEWNDAVEADWSMIPAGCIVGFSGTAHVAVSKGNGIVLEFDKVRVNEGVNESKINDIIQNRAYAHSITWAPYEEILK